MAKDSARETYYLCNQRLLQFRSRPVHDFGFLLCRSERSDPHKVDQLPKRPAPRAQNSDHWYTAVRHGSVACDRTPLVQAPKGCADPDEIEPLARDSRALVAPEKSKLHSGQNCHPLSFLVVDKVELPL